MKKHVFEYECRSCPGDGIIRGKRPGIDWPTPCPCGARRAFSQYQIGRLIEESPAAIVRIHELRARGEVAARVFRKLVSTFSGVLQ